jgi:hypothetical protein
MMRKLLINRAGTSVTALAVVITGALAGATPATAAVAGSYRAPPAVAFGGGGGNSTPCTYTQANEQNVSYEGGWVGGPQHSVDYTACNDIAVLPTDDTTDPNDNCQTFKAGFWPLVNGSLTYTQSVTTCTADGYVPLAMDLPVGTQYRIFYAADYPGQDYVYFLDRDYDGPLLPPPPPSALFTTYVRTAVGYGDFAGANPVCDAGDVVIGGGGTHSGGTRFDAMRASQPVGDPPTEWHTRYVGGDSSTEITAHVVCATSAGFTTYARTAVGYGDFAGASPACDAGDAVMSGGGTHSGGTAPTAMLASRPDGTPPTGWHTRYGGGDSSTEITAHVVCATSAGFTTYARTAVGYGDFAGASPACDAGDIVTGGGGTHSGGTRPDAMLASRPDGTPTTGWHTRYGGGNSSTQITAQVMCADVA